jgi:hypothetical protein
MYAPELTFTIPEDIGGVLRAFMAALQPLAGRRYREGPGVEVVLQEPAQENPRVPGVAADIVILACRVTAIPSPGDGGLPRGWRYEAEPREPVMRFRFAMLDGGTYVMARCDERLPPAQDDFLAALGRLRARYPAIDAALRAYETALAERRKERLRRGFGDATESLRESTGATRLGGFRPASDAGFEPTAGGGSGEPAAGGGFDGAALAEEQGDGGTDPGSFTHSLRRPLLGRGPSARGLASDSPIPSGSGGTTNTAPPIRRRGRKRTDPKEINRICAAWLKDQHRVAQIDFCNGRGISPSQLRSWLKDYPHPEG